MRLARESVLALTLALTLAACSSTPEDTSLSRRAPPSRPAAPDDRPGDPTNPADPSDEDPTNGSVTVVDLGAVSAGKRIALDLPAHALGFNIVVESDGAGSMGIEKIESPSGDVVHDAFTPKNGGFPTSEGFEGTASVSVPQNDLPSTTKLASGKWTITFGGSGTNARATARIQSTDDGAFHGGVLDIHVHVPTGLTMADPSAAHVVDAAKAGNDPDVVARVDAFFVALKRGYDIDRGKVTFHVAAAALASITTDAAVSAAASISKGSPDAQGLHLVLTNALSVGGDELLGLSPGIPGAPMRSGTSMSGIIVAHYPDTDVLTEALTWLHEMGHFVGLQHTSEFDGTLFDPLSDTPQCPGTRTETSVCPDDGNLMFTGAFGNVPVLTAGQKRVMQGSPLYRAFDSTRSAPAAAMSAHAAIERTQHPVRGCGSSRASVPRASRAR